MERWDRDIRPARKGVAFRLALRLPQLPRWGAIHPSQPGAQPPSLPVDTAVGKSGEAASEGVGAPQENGEDSSGGAAEEQTAAEVAGTADKALPDTVAPALDGNRTPFDSGEQLDTGGEAGVSAAADGEAAEQGATHAAEQVYNSVAGDARLVFEAAAALGVAQKVVAAAIQRYQRLVGAVER